MNKIEYNRNEYVENIIKTIQGKPVNQDVLEQQIDKILESMEKKVSLITFEKNAFTKQIVDGYLKRI